MRQTIAYFLDSHEFGGAENYMLRILNHLDLDRWHVVLYYHPSEGIKPLIDGARDLGVELKPVLPLPLGLEGAGRALRFARELREVQPDVFHANLTWPLSCKFGLLAAALARVPAILATLHSFPPVDYSWSTRFQLGLLARFVDCYIVVSQAMGEHLQQVFRIPKDKIHIIYNGVPVSSGSSTRPSGLTATNGHIPVVFTAARLEEQKGLDYLLQAASLVPEAKFVVAGEGPLCSQLKRMVSEYKLERRVFLIGFQAEISEWLARSDLFVLPSLFEGLPLSVLEAMAAGKPVVATQIEGVDEAVIPGETGLLVPPADPAALAGAIRSLLADPTRALAMGQSGKTRARKMFTIDSMVSGVLNCYEDLLSSQRGILEAG